jgi:extradiol dioxygenase family protein
MQLGVSFYYVGDIPKATRAYSGFLQCNPVYSDQDWVRFHLDGGNLALHLNPDLAKTEENAPIKFGAVVSITVNDIQQAITRACKQGFRLVGEVQVQPYGKQAEIRDPWGNRLSLLEPSATS